MDKPESSVCDEEWPPREDIAKGIWIPIARAAALAGRPEAELQEAADEGDLLTAEIDGQTLTCMAAVLWWMEAEASPTDVGWSDEDHRYLRQILTRRGLGKGVNYDALDRPRAEIDEEIGRIATHVIALSVSGARTKQERKAAITDLYPVVPPRIRFGHRHQLKRSMAKARKQRQRRPTGIISEKTIEKKVKAKLHDRSFRFALARHIFRDQPALFAVYCVAQRYALDTGEEKRYGKKTERIEFLASCGLAWAKQTDERKRYDVEVAKARQMWRAGAVESLQHPYTRRRIWRIAPVFEKDEKGRLRLALSPERIATTMYAPIVTRVIDHDYHKG